jgi:type VI secretion system secreted protein VgrG
MTYRMTMTSSQGDKLAAASLSGSEQLGRLFSYQLKMWSEHNDIDLLALLGSPITVTYEEEGYTRYVNGIVAEASQCGLESFQGKTYTAYSATLVPRPWLLLHKVDCRIYLQQSVPDIVKAVLAEAGYSDVKLELSASYPKREYCVQYREDYFNFISRLMEQEGIYYFFRHTQGVHTMVLADALGAHAATSGFATLPYLPQAGESGTSHEIAITEFTPARSVQTLKYSLTDYDPLKPKASLLGVDSVSNAGGNHSLSDLESFDYPGEHDDAGVGKHYAQVRVEALNAVQSQFSGATNAAGLLAGALFKLKDFPLGTLNQEYLVIGATIHIDNPLQGGDGEQLSCQFVAIQSKQPFRTMPTAVKPMVVGLQTAVVTGSDTAEDIAVDKYGRIQVTFHWNKPDKKNAHCSLPGAGGIGLGWQELGRCEHSAGWPGSGHQFPGRRPGSPAGDRQRLQRRQHAALRAARQQDPERHQESQPAWRHGGFQRIALRGQEGRGGFLHPRAEGHARGGGKRSRGGHRSRRDDHRQERSDHHGQARPEAYGGERPDRDDPEQSVGHRAEGRQAGRDPERHHHHRPEVQARRRH